MEWLNPVISAVAGLAGGGTIGVIWQANKSAKVGLDANEVEATKAINADWATYTQEIREMLQHERELFRKERASFQEQMNSVNDELKDLRERVSKMERR